MDDHKYSISETGVLTDETSGEVFPYRFVFDEIGFWADEKSLLARWTVVVAAPEHKHAGKTLRLGVKNGTIERVRLVKQGEAVESFGHCRSPRADQFAPAAHASHPRSPLIPLAATVDFEGNRFGLDSLAVLSNLAELPDGRLLVLFRASGGRILGSSVLQDEPKETPRGVAWLVGQDVSETPYVGGQASSAGAMTVHAEDALAPVRPEELTDLFDTSSRALDTDKHPDAPVINLPIRFWALSAEDKATGNHVKPPIQGIPLFRFEVDPSFGAASDRKEKKKDEEDDRYAYLLLTTAPGVLVTDRDTEEPWLAPAGTLVWVDEKYDLRPMIRALPRWREEACVRLTEVLLTPKKLAKFEVDGETRKAWRIELKILRNLVHPKSLAKIRGLLEQLPELPIRQKAARTVEADSWE